MKQIDSEMLRMALVGYEQELKAVSDAIAALRNAMGVRRRGRPAGAATQPKPATNASKPKRRRRMSAEGRKRIAEAQRKRWAAVKKAGQ